MVEFKVSAPGRMFLSGEHVMMYGKDVVATAIDLRTTLKFVELINDTRNIIKIEFPDVNLSLNLSLELIQNYFFTNDFFPLIENHNQLLKHVQYFITKNGLWSTYEQRYSLQTFLFLLLFIAYTEKLDIKSFYVRLTTQLPISAGFGSSTSFAVCLAACFLHWSRLQKGAHIDFDNEELNKIMSYVSICEKDVQNYGIIDSIVCICGQVLKARYKNFMNYHFTFLSVPRIKILLVDSGICQNNYEKIMAQMAQIKLSNESDFFLRMMDGISHRILVKLVNISNSMNNNNLQLLHNSHTVLGIFISSSQDIFRKADLSHPSLDSICSIAKDYYGLVGKLTSFYGYVYIPCPPYVSAENIRTFIIHILLEGFTVKTTEMGCNGVELEPV